MGRIRSSQQQMKKSEINLAPVANTETGNHLILVFASPEIISDPTLPDQLKQTYPGAVIAGCTTAGEITAAGVEDNSLTITSLAFERTQVRTACTRVASMDDSYQAGVALAESLKAEDLAYLLILSDGLAVNGSSLVSGIRETLPPGTPFSGGLAGDADRFQKTFTLDNTGAHEESVIGIGFYGSSLRVRRGSVGGWAPFGPYRTVTRSKANVVYEFDNGRALDVYSTYLGDEAKDLPAAGLLFPLAMSPEENRSGLIRTLLAIDREDGSLTFAGDVPEGTIVQLMHANYDQLIEGARDAANECMTGSTVSTDFALLISCVGRKLMLGNNTDLEVDAVSESLGRDVTCAGFYSYGEIGPFDSDGECQLHNQTMTVTVLSEEE